MEKIERIVNHPDFRLYLDNCSQLEKMRVFCTHDFNHLLTVARLTYLLLLERGEQPDQKEMAYAAGLLHDIGRWREYIDGSDHALAGAELARPILKAAGFRPAEIELIAKAIGEHRRNCRSGERRDPLSRALQEADHFSRLCFQCPAKGECRKYSSMPHENKLCY